MTNLRNLDLHALECFDVLMRERSVSRTAERLGMSQSSASEMLARLRERFGDPLLVRTRDGMAPTPRAEALLPRVRATLDHLRGLLEEPAFEPARSTERFRITTSDYTQLLLMPELTRRLAAQAPGCTIDVLPVHIQRVEQALDAGDIDLAIAYFPEPPPSLRRAPLFTDRIVGIARCGHPLVTASLDAERFAALSHIGVAPSGVGYFIGIVDSALESLGLRRRIAVSSPHFLLAAHLVSQSDLVLALPQRAAVMLAQFFRVTIFELPMTSRTIELAMYWHERCHHARAQQWLREHAREVLASDRPR